MISETSAAAVMLAFVLGNRHGFDADHLAAIDGLTRWNWSAGRPRASLCGVFFSAGHAGIIIAMSAALYLLSSHVTPPHWLETVGTVISGGTLILLGVLNLRAAFIEDTAPPALRSRLLAPLLRASRPWQVALVGALFAISFDAVALSALFAASKSALGDVLLAGSSFAAGMLVVGAANGWWVLRLIRHSHRAGGRAARVMPLTIAVATLAVSAHVLLPLTIRMPDEWLANAEWLMSIGTMTVVLAGYFLSAWIFRGSAVDPTTHGEKSCAG